MKVLILILPLWLTSCATQVSSKKLDMSVETIQEQIDSADMYKYYSK